MIDLIVEAINIPFCKACAKFIFHASLSACRQRVSKVDETAG